MRAQPGAAHIRFGFHDRAKQELRAPAEWLLCGLEASPGRRRRARRAPGECRPGLPASAIRPRASRGGRIKARRNENAPDTGANAVEATARHITPGSGANRSEK